MNNPADELCANCDLSLDGHISNTGCVSPCWKPSGRYRIGGPLPTPAKPKYKGATCRGSLAIGSGCNNCEKCLEERERLRLKPDFKSSVEAGQELAKTRLKPETTEKDVLDYLTLRMSIGTSEAQVLRWSGVIGAFHAAMLGDRKEQEAAMELKRLGGSIG